MFKEHFRTQNKDSKQNSLHQSHLSLFNKIQNLEIEKICLEFLFDNHHFLELSQWWKQRGTIHYRTFKYKRVLPVCY